MVTLRKFRALSPRHRWLVLRSVALLAAVRVGLLTLPFSTLRAVLARFARPRAASHDCAPRDELAWGIGVAARCVPRATCLVRALALQVLLGRSGYDAELKIGVAKEDGRLKAHAWVESGGRQLLQDVEPARFATLQTGR